MTLRDILNQKHLKCPQTKEDIGAGLRNFFGGRSQGYEDELMKARDEALEEIKQRANSQIGRAHV